MNSLTSGNMGTAGRMFGGLLNQAAEATMRNLEKILPTKRELLTTKIVTTLMENRPSDEKTNVDNYVYIDPKMPPSTRVKRVFLFCSFSFFIF